MVFVFKYLAQKPDIYRCICSNRDRLGFHAEIQIIFGIVCTTIKKNMIEHLQKKVQYKHPIDRIENEARSMSGQVKVPFVSGPDIGPLVYNA